MISSPQVGAIQAPAKSHPWRWFKKRYSQFCVLLMVVGGVIWFTSSPHAQHFHTGPFKSGAVLMTVGFIGLAGFWFIVFWATWFVLMWRAMGHSMHAAMKPIPTPQQIAVEFQATYGRPPSWEEINAIHALLTRQRNEGVAGAAAIIGGVALASHLSQGHKS